MEDFSKQKSNIWIRSALKMGQYGVLHPKYPWIVTFIGGFWIVSGVLRIAPNLIGKGEVDIIIGVLTIFVAIVWLERKQFYQIIEIQKRQIAELRTKILQDERLRNN